MNNSQLKDILVNFKALFTINLKRRINDNSARITRLEEMACVLDQRMTAKYHYHNLLDYYGRHQEEALSYQKELNYLQRYGEYCCFPYKPASILEHVVTGIEKESQLPYVIHKNKKLFFRANHTLVDVLELYQNYIQTERLLGNEDTEDAPHQYQSPRVHVSDGDVVFDIGAAEGLFALDQIEKASHVVIVESDPEWIIPLKQTFAPYKDKVTIIQKFVSDTDTDTTISIENILSQFDYRSAFIKMDIEGYEQKSITAAERALRKGKGIKLSVASYHKQHDAEEMKSFFDDIGYFSEYSTGYMLFHLYDTPTPPYFRKGVIRAYSL